MSVKWQQVVQGQSYFAWAFDGTSSFDRHTIFRAQFLPLAREWQLEATMLPGQPKALYPTLQSCKVAAANIYRKVTQ